MKIVIEATNLEELKTLLEQLTSKVPSTINRHINSLALNNRTRNCLLAEGIQTLEQLFLMSEDDLRRIPNLGIKAVDEIRGVLQTIGFNLT